MAKSAILMAENGEVLWENNADEKLEPASVTKVMTLILVSEAIENRQISMDDVVTVSGYAVDLYLSGSKQSVQAFIFTKKYEEMADAIAFDMKRGVTVIPAKGWFSKEDVNVVMVVTRKSDLNLLLRYVKTIDSEAFLSVSSAMGVYGKGFDTIKVKQKNDKKS